MAESIIETTCEIQKLVNRVNNLFKNEDYWLRRAEESASKPEGRDYSRRALVESGKAEDLMSAAELYFGLQFSTGWEFSGGRYVRDVWDMNKHAVVWQSIAASDGIED